MNGSSTGLSLFQRWKRGFTRLLQVTSIPTRRLNAFSMTSGPVMSGKDILWTGLALEDLEHIRNYVKRDDPLAAAELAERIRRGVKRLSDHPESGRTVPELGALGLREVVVSPYRIVYSVEESRVVILRVWHGRRGRPDPRAIRTK